MKYIPVIILSLLLFSCGNKSRQVSTPTLPEAQIEESYQQPDTIVTEEEEELQEEVKKLKSGKNTTVECDTNVTEVNKLKEALYVSETNAKYWEDLNKKKKKILNHILNDIYLDAQKR